MVIPTKEEMKKEEELNKKFSLNFTRRELLIIYNLILREGNEPRRYTMGDWFVIAPILDKLQPFVAVDTNIPLEDQGKQDSNGIIKGKKVEA